MIRRPSIEGKPSWENLNNSSCTLSRRAAVVPPETGHVGIKPTTSRKHNRHPTNCANSLLKITYPSSHILPCIALDPHLRGPKFRGRELKTEASVPQLLSYIIRCLNEAFSFVPSSECVEKLSLLMSRSRCWSKMRLSKCPVLHTMLVRLKTRGNLPLILEVWCLSRRVLLSISLGRSWESFDKWVLGEVMMKRSRPSPRG